MLTEECPHAGEDLAALDEDVFHIIIHQQVHIAHAVTALRVSEGIVDIALRIGLDHWKGAKRLGDEFQLLHQDGEFTCLGLELGSGYRNEIPDIEEFLEDVIIKRLILSRADLIPVDIELHASFSIFQLGK